MVETNPYETNNDIPEFVGKKKEDVDMSVFKLNQEELEDEEVEEEAPKRRVNKQQLVMLITAAVAVVLCIILLFTLVAKSKALTSSQSAYKTLEETTASKIARLEKEVSELTEDKKTLEKEVEELKAAQVVVTPPNQGGSNSGSGNNNGTTVTPAGSYSTGTYTLTAGLKVRTGAGTSYEAKASLSAGDKVTVVEVQTTGTQVWGKVRDNEWICLKNGNEAYVK